jgi:hypothetical protein
LVTDKKLLKEENLMKFFFIIVLFIYGLFFLPAESCAQWTAIDSGLTNYAVLSFAVVPNGTDGAYLFSTTDITVNGCGNGKFCVPHPDLSGARPLGTFRMIVETRR